MHNQWPGHFKRLLGCNLFSSTKMLQWAVSLFALILECRCALLWNLTDLFLLDLELINL